MRRRLVFLVALTTSLVLVAFLLPLALLVRTMAADHATNAAIREAEGLAPLIGTLDQSTLAVTVQQLSHDDAEDFPLTVFLPDGGVLGAPAPVSPAVQLARSGRSITVAYDDGREVLVAAQGGPGGTAVIRSFVSSNQLRHGVWQTWLILGLLGLSLLGFSLLVAGRIARSIVAPIDALVSAAHRLAGGDLDARVTPAGPPEVRDVAAELNLLAARIGELLAAEREDVAELSHQLRTPLTALRLGVDAVAGGDDKVRLTDALSALERTVDRVIREARRPIREGVGAGCDAAAVTADRLAFWSALADEEERLVTADVPETPVPVRTPADDLATALDALLGNVFAHTPEGTAFGVALERRPEGGAILTVSDEGPGLIADPAVSNGATRKEGSTGLGLDIVRRTALASRGAMRLGSTRSGGAEVSVTLGEPAHLLGVHRSAPSESPRRQK